MLAVAHVLGLLLAFFGAAYLLPIGCSIFTGDGLALYFVVGAACSTGAGLLMVALTTNWRRELKPRDGFLLVTLVWITTSALATIPLLMALPAPQFHAGFLRDDVRNDFDGLHRVGRPRFAGPFAQPVAPRAAVGGGPRHHRDGARRAAPARGRWTCSSTRARRRARSRTTGSRRGSRRRPGRSGWCTRSSPRWESLLCVSAECPGSMRSAMPSRRSDWAASQLTMPAWDSSIRRRSSLC